MVLRVLRLIFSRYSLFLHSAPLFIYVFYVIFRGTSHPIISTLIKTGLISIGLGTTYFIMGQILGIPFKTLTQFTWSYSGPITWGTFFLTYFYILNKKEDNNLTSFTLATLAAFGGGWLYEISFFHPLSMFLGKGFFFYNNIQIMCFLLILFEQRKKGLPNPIIYAILLLSMFLGWIGFPYPNGQIICLILLGYELRKMGFKPNLLTYATLILFMTFSAALFLDKDIVWQSCKRILGFWNPALAMNIRWVYRIPASLFLLSLLSGIEKKSEMMK